MRNVCLVGDSSFHFAPFRMTLLSFIVVCEAPPILPFCSRCFVLFGNDAELSVVGFPF